MLNVFHSQMWTVTEERDLCWVAQQKIHVWFVYRTSFVFQNLPLLLLRQNIFTTEKIFKVIKKECS